MAQGEVSMEVREPRTAPSGHVEYEVVCSILERLAGQPSALPVRWSVWRRFSEFASLDYTLRRGFGSALEGVDLPPKQWFGTGQPDFIIARCRALNGYIQCVQRRCHGVTRFDTHQGSADLAAFLRWHERVELSLLPERIKAAVRGDAAGPGGSSGGGAAAAGGAGAEPAPEAAAGAPAAARGSGAARRPLGPAAAARLQARSAIASATLAPSAQRLAVDSSALQHYTAGVQGAAAAASPYAFTVGASAAQRTPQSLAAEAPAAAGPAPRAQLTYTPPPSATRTAAPTPAAAAPSPQPQAAAAAPRPPPQQQAAPASAPPPPPSSVPAAVANPDPDRASLLSAIASGGGGFKLKKAVTNDRSSPLIKK